MRRFRAFFLVPTLALLLCRCGPAGPIPAYGSDASYPLSLERDEEGWTVFVPSPDTRLIYVSEDGSDASGTCYAPDAAAIGADPFDPAGTVRAFRTYAAAAGLARPGYPDWILFERGGTYPARIWNPAGGRSETEFALIASYGNGPLPVLEPTERDGTVFTSFNRAFSFFALAHVEAYNPYHDPASSRFAGYEGGGNGFSVLVGAHEVRQILLEGVRFRRFANNGMQSLDGWDIREFVIRRCAVLDNYHTDDAHSQGMYCRALTGLLLEECVFDHNGWYDRPSEGNAPATMFNHNTYLTDCSGVVFRNNVFLRASSIHNKFTANSGEGSASNILLENNLYADGEIGVSMGGNVDQPYKFADIEAVGNVFTEIGRSRPTERYLGWGFDVADWDGGRVADNYFIHNATEDVRDSYGISINGGCRGVVVSGNVVYGLNERGGNPNGAGIRILDRDAKSGVVVSGNLVQEPRNPFKMIDLRSSAQAAGFAFSDNQYFQATGEADSFRIDGSTASFAAWKALTGDDSRFAELDFAQPGRDLAGYQRSIGGTPTVDAFIAACRAQDRTSWDPRYGAAAVNAWLKAGFRVK